MPVKTVKAYSKDYTKPKLRKELKEDIQANSKGGKSKQWSARKSQILKNEYEKKGGDYKHSSKKTSFQKEMSKWTKENSKSRSKNCVSSRKKSKTTSFNDDYFIAPVLVARAAEKGLSLHKEFSRGGTEVGVARAVQLKNQSHLSLKTIKRMLSYFKRHAIDKKAKNFGKTNDPSNGYIAWLLWGGDAGYHWVKKLLKPKK